MKTKITIPIHSFVSLITNSSSEIFVNASESTVNSIKEIINSLLALGGSNLKSDDLFDVYLEVMDYNTYKYIREDSPEVANAKTSSYDNYSESNVSVKVKDGVTDKNAETAAKLLTHVTNLFSFDAVYNG